ncbi:hypothetical protein [Desulfohalovibrio reitneri]|uniref:hypothetical protein n=1 Tax=Desulfohalovibrio reitneri TaxID=1307759 RepID=UPI0004A76133|nr:hypothetical protein [Desulfohalovibrio reitneri]
MNVSPEERERLKRAIYEKMAPRRRRWIEKIGYENWDPFQEPQDPIDIRKDKNRLTASQLLEAFRRAHPDKEFPEPYMRGANELALGLINGDERIQGMYEFARWYAEKMDRPETPEE